MNWQRATTDEKKQQRKQQIYKAALRLFKRDGYDKVSFNAIALEAGFTKSNMYRYFSSKEEVFLNVFSVLFEHWVEDCIQRLQLMQVDEDIHNFSKEWVASQVAHPKFLDLTPLLFVALEKNSSFEQLQVFKTLAKTLLFKIVMEISRIYPQFDIDKSFKFMNLSYAATANYWAAESQSEALQKIYQMQEFQELAPNFEKDLSASIEIILLGLKQLKSK